MLYVVLSLIAVLASGAAGECRTLSHFAPTKWSVLVENSWKGVEGDTVFVYSAHPTSCGYGFEPGERYLIYGNYDDTARLARYAWPSGQPARILATGVCHRTCRLAEASEDLAQLPERSWER